MGSRFFFQIPVKRRKNASRISRPCTMPTSMPNKRDLGVLSVRTVYKRVNKGGRHVSKASQSPPLRAEADAENVRNGKDGVAYGKSSISFFAALNFALTIKAS